MSTRYAYRLETRRVKEDEFPYKTGPFSNPDKVKEFLRVLDGFDNEQFITLLLNAKNQLIGICRQSGTLDQTAVYPREIAKHCLLSGAASVILAHNHPSGSTVPSQADREITRMIKEALSLFNIRVHDHMIVGDETIYSMSEAGLV